MTVDKMISLENLYVDIGALRLILIVTKTRLAIYDSYGLFACTNESNPFTKSLLNVRKLAKRQ